MVELPTGTVTFLLTDVEGSTALWEQASEAMRTALARHDALFEAAVVEHGGDHIRPRGEGDSRFAVFTSATNALAAAVAIQRSFAFESWPTPTPIKVRIGVHTGEAELRQRTPAGFPARHRWRYGPRRTPRSGYRPRRAGGCGSRGAG